MKSQAAAISQPPPYAAPLTAAMTGTGQLIRRAHHALEDRVLGLPLLVGHGAALDQIAAGAEGAVAGAGHHDAAQAVLLDLQRLEHRHQIEAHLRVHGVRRRRPIEPDDKHRGSSRSSSRVG